MRHSFIAFVTALILALGGAAGAHGAGTDSDTPARKQSDRWLAAFNTGDRAATGSIPRAMTTNGVASGIGIRPSWCAARSQVVWAPYEFWIDGKTTLCGIDTFDMVKVDGRWRVANSMWTVEPEG